MDQVRYTAARLSRILLTDIEERFRDNRNRSMPKEDFLWSRTKVIASGKGYVAEKIIDVAGEHDIPVHKDAKLTKSLEKLEIGEYIPKELYQVVAEVLVYVDAMDKIKGKVMDKGKKDK